MPRTVARVNNPKNEWMFDEAWGVDVAVSTPRLMTALVEEAVSVGDLVRIFKFQQGKATMVELTLPGEQPVRRDARRRRPLARTTPCSSASSARTARSRRAATTPLEALDELLFITTPDNEDVLEQMLSPGARPPRSDDYRSATRRSSPHRSDTSRGPRPKSPTKRFAPDPRNNSDMLRASRAVTRRTLATTQTCPGSGCWRAVQAAAGLASGSSSGVLPLSSRSPMTSTASR